MDDIDIHSSIEEIIKELDDKNLLYMTSGKIKEIKNNILQKLYISKEELKQYHKQLKEYIYVDELEELTLGSFVRWFDLRDPEQNMIKLKKGGFVVDYKQGKDDVIIVYKTYSNVFLISNE